MKRNLLRTLFLSIMMILGATGVWADEITATLDHTAGAQWGSNTGASTVDAEKEHYNNDAATAWAGCAYAKFSYTIPEGHSITKAQLTYSVNQGGRSGRDDIIYYMKKDFDLDWATFAGQTGLDLRNASNRADKAVAAASTGGTGDRINLSQDVTDAVKAIFNEGQNYIIFQWTGNAGGADLYGKASANAPTLVITTADVSSVTSYTVKFTDGTNELKDAAVYTNVAIGSEQTASSADIASFVVGDKKYIYVSGNSTITTVADAATNVITLVFREAATYNYTVKSSLGTTIFEGTGFESDAITYYFPQYLLSEGVLYNTPANNKEYRNTTTLDADNKVITVNYSATETNDIVFLKEAEDIEGATASAASNADIRCSMGKGAFFANDAVVTTLQPGKYKLTAQVWGNATTTFVIKAGEATVLSIDTKGYVYSETSEEFELTKATDITIPAVGNENRVLDLVYIQKTGDVEVADPNDYTSYIVNADLTGEGGFDATGTKGISGGIVKVGNASAFDFKQTIANLPAGKYKVTAQAAYRFGADEAAEAAAITAGTDTKLVQLYATVGEKTVATKVQNRYDGASETDYANGSGSVTVNEKFVPNSSDAVKAWFAAGKYVNEVTFNLPADGAVTIGINRTGTPESDYTVIGPWTLTRLGDAEVEPEPAIEPGTDMTSKIVNPSFETGDLTGWTVTNSSDTGVKPNSNATYTAEGCDGDYLFNTWWKGNPITQTIAGLPNGLYELKVLVTNDAGEGNNDKPCIFLIANGAHSDAIPTTTKSKFEEGSLQFYVIDGTATIGVVGGNGDGTFNAGGYYWYKADNFRLKYVAALPSVDDIEIPEGKMSVAAANAITTAKEAGDVIALMTAVKNAKASIEAYAHMKKVLDDMTAIAEATNVYTAEAKTTFDAAVAAAQKGYEEGTVSDADASAFNYGSRLEGTLPTLLLSAFTSTVEGTPYINTWSVEGNNDGSNFYTPFFEYWVSDGNSLGANDITATLNGVEPGKYDVTALVRVRAKNGYEAPATGITMQANDDEAVNVAAGDQIGTSQFFLKEFTATGTVAENGVLKIKFNVAADNNISWLSFKNVMVTKNLGEPIFTLNAKVGEEVSIKPGVYDEFDVFSVDFGDGVLVTDSVGHQNKGVCVNDGTETWPQKEGTTHTSITEFKGTVAGDGIIKVYGNSDIWYLAVSGATLAVDQPKLKKVVQFTMSKVAVESLDLTGLDDLKIFGFSQGSLKNINLKNNAALTNLTINNNTASAFESVLESLDLSGNANLEQLNVMAASATKPGVLKTLDLSANTKLTNLYAQYNALESVILPENATLSFANLQNNKIATIDLSKVASLKDTYLNNNLLTEVDLSKVVEGANLYLDGNQLTTVNVPVVVKNLQLNDNKLTSATIAGATASCKLENNAFTLATLPAQPAGLNTASKTKKFTYASQAALEVAETVSELDLTSQLTVAKGELNPETVGEAAAYTTWLENQTTTFSFVTAGGTALVEGTDYEVVEPGKFKFLKAQEEKVHAVMLNAAFPKFTEAAPFTTTEFTVEAATGEEFEEVKVTYALKEGETHVSADVVEVKNEDKVVATITYGEAGGEAFHAAAANAAVEGFEAFTDGNGQNGNKEGGTFYTIVPKFDGKIDVAVVLNKDKSFYILEDGTALTDFDGITVSDKMYGTFTFDVKAEKAYKIYAAGTKLGFYGFNYTYKQAKQPEVTELELTLNVERYTGMGYGATEATVDFTEAKAFLGVEAITEDMLSVLNPDGNAISDFKAYDGWFNGEGVAETWGDNTKINVKFFEAIAGEGKYSICDMNGADEVGKTYSVKWQLAANGKKVIYTINVTFVAAPEFKPEIVKTIDVPVYMTAEAAYEGLTAQFDAAEVATALNIASIADAKAYIVNVTTGSFVENTTDGWRDANGDATQWPNATNGLCAKIQDPASGTIDYLGTHDANFMENDTYTAKWGFVANEKAVVLNINITFKSAAFMTRINSMKSDSQQGTIYNLNGQKVNKAQKGLNIINGKKIVIK
ncbi:hypothetical protein [Prevotella communis]|uniref:hypothetical protein n=1 Tax=Prevotella communis TaxID=2913614 RepID=UPI001EDB5377|nr:hypothetical protein [Prevotella communis]UKK56283.1 hypothetical protein L6476_12640 [Prevotella communis]